MNDSFDEHRPMLLGLAYRMLGSMAEAEDLVQEAYLRWLRQPGGAIGNAAAWLATAVTRLCIDHLRSARVRREAYVGVWLPEPIVDLSAPAPDRMAERADSLATAFLLMLETLAPAERAIFLLREAFEYEYAIIAEIVGKSEANCRQIVRRARERLAETTPVHKLDPARATDLVRRFSDACESGNLQEFLAVLSDGAVLYTDGGGRVKSARRPIRTADRIARFFVGLHERAFAGAESRLIEVNGGIGVLTRRRNGALSVSSFRFEGDRIRDIFTVTNPDKLRHVSWTGREPETSLPGLVETGTAAALNRAPSG